MAIFPMGGRFMSITRQVTCPITGQTLILGKDYFLKKAEEYGSEENLRKYYVSKKAKKLLLRGYSVDEIRKILTVDESSVPKSAAISVTDVVEHHLKEKGKGINKRLESNLNFIMQTSDDDVIDFINNITNPYGN